MPCPLSQHLQSMSPRSSRASTPRDSRSTRSPFERAPRHAQQASVAGSGKSLSALDLLPPSKRVKWLAEPASDLHKPSHSSQSRSGYSTPSVFDRPPSKSRRGSEGAPTPPRPSLRRGMTGMLDIDRSHNRRERTFAGSQCVVCEEPLENTLRGERILQLSCAHVSHEACFYEYIREFDAQNCPGCDAPLGLDPSKGGNVLDIGKLSSIVRSLQPSDGRQQQPPSAQQQQPPPPNHHHHHQQRSASVTPIPWDHHNAHQSQYSQRPYEPSTAIPRTQSEPALHGRTPSAGTELTSSANGSADAVRGGMHSKRQDFDEATVDSSRGRRSVAARSPIPPPSVLVRSEYPTLTRARQPQSLTCLVTVEVPEAKWQPNVEDMASPNSPPALNRARTQDAGLMSPRLKSVEETQATPEEMERVKEQLYARVDSWHGLDFSRFGTLYLHAKLRVGKDRQSWQELECYLFTEMLICVKEKRISEQAWNGETTTRSRCSLKGSIMIKKHLKAVGTNDGDNVLTLGLSVPELPSFHLYFSDGKELRMWERQLKSLLGVTVDTDPGQEYEQDTSGAEEEEYKDVNKGPASSRTSSYTAGRSIAGTLPTEYSDFPPDQKGKARLNGLHVPVDIVLVMPVSASMHGLKISLLRDTLRFFVESLGPRDRLGLVTFGSSGGAVPVVGMASKAWQGWNRVVESVRPVGQKSPRADLIEGASVAMDLLMQRKSTNPVSSVFIVSDSSTSDADSKDFVLSRAEAAKVSIYCFGLGLTHKPDTMIELSTRSKASYTYVKDWMMLRECVAGCLGSLQTISHQNVKLRLKLPDGSPAKFAKISGALQTTKRANGRDAEASLGDLRFGDKRDILVQLAIAPAETASVVESVPQDHWESIVSGLEALGGNFDKDEESRSHSVEEVPMIQADLTFSDILREGVAAQLPRPSLLAISMLPSGHKTKSANGRPSSPPIPPHPSIVQRRMELLTSDMLSRALTLVTRGQHDRAHHLLRETRTIIKGLGKGGLPPIPQSRASARQSTATASTQAPRNSETSLGNSEGATPDRQPPSPPQSPLVGAPAPGIDPSTMSALDSELESALEWINHPAVFGRDSRKAVLQAIGIISSQRAYTFRTTLESLWAGRITGIRRLTETSKIWRESNNEESLPEEA